MLIQRREPSPGVRLLGGSIFLIIGLVFVIAGYIIVRDEVTLLGDPVAVTATIVDRYVGQDCSGDNGCRQTYNVRYQFSALDGSPHGGGARVPSSTYRSLDVGDPFEIVYARSNPAIHRPPGIASTAIMFVFPLIGLVAIVVSPFLFGMRLPRPGRGRNSVRQIHGDDNTLWMAYRRPLSAGLWGVFGPLFGVALSSFFVLLGFTFPDDALLFGIFGLFFLALMLVSTVLGLYRLLTTPDSLRLGPRGIWLPSTGVIPWGDVASIGVEDAAAAVGHDPSEGQAVNQSLRLAITLTADGAVRGTTALDDAMLRIDEAARAASHRTGGPTLGVFEMELPVPLEEILTEIERYRPQMADVRSTDVQPVMGKAPPDAASRADQLTRLLEAIGPEPGPQEHP